MLILVSLVLLSWEILFVRSELIIDPTLKPAENFSACDDACFLTTADEKQTAIVIFHRTYQERKQIETFYNEKYSNGAAFTLLDALLKKAKSEDDLRLLYYSSLVAPEQILAETIFGSIISGTGEVGGIEEVVCANDKIMKDRIDQYYQINYQKTVTDHLATFRSEDKAYQDVMQKYCWPGLCQETKLTPEDADREAQALRSIHPKKHKTDFKNKLIEFLDKYSEPDLKLIFQKYRQGDNGIEDAISHAFKEEREKRAYNVLVRYIEDTCKFYASELRHAADDSKDIHTEKINRIVLTRSERDLFCIAKAYPSQDGYQTFTSRLSDKIKWRHLDGGFLRYSPLEPLYVESIRYLLGKP